MWICPVCDQKCVDNLCSRCGFDRSSDFEHFPTLQMAAVPAAAISQLQGSYRAKSMATTCLCCSGVVTGDYCTYCNFPSIKNPTERSSARALQQAMMHANKIVASLTDFSIVSYHYAWVPERSRLEYQSEENLRLGDARDFFNTIVWADQNFGQLRNGTGTELNLAVSYHYYGTEKVVHCNIPTVKCDNFWKFGISMDRTLHLRLYLGSGKKFIESAPIALDLT